MMGVMRVTRFVELTNFRYTKICSSSLIRRKVREMPKSGDCLFPRLDFDFPSALILRDDRRDYGEARFIALGSIGRRLRVVVYIVIDGGIRVISLRKANARERKRYGQKF